MSEGKGEQPQKPYTVTESTADTARAQQTAEKVAKAAMIKGEVARIKDDPRRQNDSSESLIASAEDLFKRKMEPFEPGGLHDTLEESQKMARDTRRAQTDLLEKLAQEQNKTADAERRSMIDTKTDLPNSMFFSQVVEAEIAEVNRYPTHRSNRLVIADIDDFGQFNRIHGELFGDKVLYEVARTMQKSVRDTDTVARWGGEEMVVSMPVEITNGSNPIAQLEAVRRIRENIENISLTSPKTNEPVKLTASLGTATYEADESFESYFTRADDAMGIAKLLGKNRVIEAGFDAKHDQIYTDLANNHVYMPNFDENHTGTIIDTTDKTIYTVALGENGKPKIVENSSVA